MKLKLCFLTPEQEAALKAEKKNYTADDRNGLGLVVNAVYDLVHILETYTLDNQGEASEEQYLTMFQTLGRLMEPVYEYFSETAGYSFKE